VGGRVDPKQVFLTCTLCPGICISKCPVYTTLRVRSSAPHVIARSGLRLLRGGDVEEALNLYLCTGCGSCQQACPLDNPLPEAIRVSRRRLSEPPRPTVKPLYLGGSGERLLLVSPEMPGKGVVEHVSRAGYAVYWLDSTPYTIAYWSGASSRIHTGGFDVVVTEDLDAPVEDAMNGLELLNAASIGVTRRVDDYILHVPCKARGVEKAAAGILGRPSRVLRSCSGGGGGMMHYMRDYSIQMAGLAASRGPIVTLCRWSKLVFKMAGYSVYTVLDLVA